MKCTMAGRGVCETCENTDKTGLTFRGRILYNEKRAEPKSCGSFCFDRMEILKKAARSAFHGTKAGNPAKIKNGSNHMQQLRKKLRTPGVSRA